jgi:hypothetical protein
MNRPRFRGGSRDVELVTPEPLLDRGRHRCSDEEVDHRRGIDDDRFSHDSCDWRTQVRGDGRGSRRVSSSLVTRTTPITQSDRYLPDQRVRVIGTSRIG